MDYLPAPELRKILLPSYKPCEEFRGTCKGVVKWKPKNGDVPRGFIGATSGLNDVEVVILIAEPGQDDGSDPFPKNASRSKYLQRACIYTYQHYEERYKLFHRNMRLLLDLIFPSTKFQQQLRKVWITETFLCSIPDKIGQVPVNSEKECAERYLTAQLNLLKGRPIIVLGGKARRRVKRLKNSVPDLMHRLIHAYAVAPPGSNHSKAQPSWEEAARKARSMIWTKEWE